VLERIPPSLTLGGFESPIKQRLPSIIQLGAAATSAVNGNSKMTSARLNLSTNSRLFTSSGTHESTAASQAACFCNSSFVCSLQEGALETATSNSVALAIQLIMSKGEHGPFLNRQQE